MRDTIFIIFVVLVPSALRAQDGGRTVESRDGVTIRYEVNGSGEPALVFVHGWLCDRTYWSEQVEHFATTHQVITLDLAGHGQSDGDRSRFTMSAFGEDVAVVVRSVDPDRVILIGHSMGGTAAAEAAKLLTGRAVALVGVDTFRDIDNVLTAAEIDAFLLPFQRNFKGAAEPFVRRMFTADTAPDLVERIVTDMLAAEPEAAISCMRGVLASYPTSEILAELDLPLITINADHRLTNVSAARRAGMDVFTLSGLGHFLQLEAPMRFNEELAAVLDGIVSKYERRNIRQGEPPNPEFERTVLRFSTRSRSRFRIIGSRGKRRSEGGAERLKKTGERQAPPQVFNGYSYRRQSLERAIHRLSEAR